MYRSIVDFKTGPSIFVFTWLVLVKKQISEQKELALALNVRVTHACDYMDTLSQPHTVVNRIVITTLCSIVYALVLQLMLLY